MSRNEDITGQLVDGMVNLKCSEVVDHTSTEFSASENLTWSNRFLTFSEPTLTSKCETFTDLFINQEKNNFNPSKISFNVFDSTDTPSIAGSSSDYFPMTEFGTCVLKYRSEASPPRLPIPDNKDGEKVQSIPNHESTYPRLIRQKSTRNSFRKNRDPLESTDILQEAVQILHSLSSDISRSLDDIPKSIALPSVIEKYSRRTIGKSLPQDNLSNAKTPVGDLSTFISPSEEILQLLAALQCRCLEYREATLDIAESIAKLLNFSDVSICLMKGLIARYDTLREDFTNFKTLCFRAKGSRTGSEPLSCLITDCLQTSYLRLLVEENETFLVRLKFGIYMVRVNARLMRDLKEASMRVLKLEEEVDYITRTTIGYRV